MKSLIKITQNNIKDLSIPIHWIDHFAKQPHSIQSNSL